MADCDGSQLWYERRGSGERVLYCNGSGATLESAGPALDRLAAEFDVVGFDHRGMGHSPLGDDGYSMADCATDVIGLLDHLGWDRCRFVGLSFGGMVAQEVAVTRPDRIERLVLMSTSPGGAFPSFPLEQLAALPSHERASRSLLLADRRWTDEWFATHPEDLQVVMSLAAGQSGTETDEQRRGRLAQLAARQDHDVLDRLGRVTCPTYVACGHFDGIAPVANSEQIARLVPDAQLSVFDGGHLFMFQDPTAWPEIVEFLARPTG